jgi:hypothetical protein
VRHSPNSIGKIRRPLTAASNGFNELRVQSTGSAATSFPFSKLILKAAVLVRRRLRLFSFGIQAAELDPHSAAERSREHMPPDFRAGLVNRFNRTFSDWVHVSRHSLFPMWNRHPVPTTPLNPTGV